MRFFKYDFNDLSQLFIPWNEPEYCGFLTDQERRATKLKHAPKMYSYAHISFRNGSESDYLWMNELVGAKNTVLPEVVEVDYEGFEKEIDLKEFRKDVANYVSKLASNFMTFLIYRLGNAETNFQVQRIFENNLQQLYNSYKNLDSLTQEKSVKKVPKLIAEIHLESYKATYDALKLSYTDLFDHLLKIYRLDSNEQYNASDVFRYLETNARRLFESFELQLIEKDYLNPKLNLWKRDKKALVLFHIYCRERNMLRPGWKEKNDFLRSLEIRYNKETGDQGKPGLWKRKPEDYSPGIAKGEYWFLQNIK
jgi:hypothetical protein